MALLRTVPEVIAELGGRGAVQQRFDASQQRVFNWISRGTFPPATFEAITAELAARGHAAAPTLWKSVPISVLLAAQPEARA